MSVQILPQTNKFKVCSYTRWWWWRRWI